jgi:aryl carrier-like protein
VALVAILLGLRVVATVKTKEEKDALENFSGMQSAQILYSKDAALSKALLRLTKGVGVDVVFNTSSTAFPAELVASVKAFGTVIDAHQQSVCFSFAHRAVKYVSFDTSQLLRHLPSIASSAFKTVVSLLRDGDFDGSMPIIAVPISDVASAFKAVQGQKNVGKTVLLAEEDALINVKEAVVPLAHVDRIIRAINELSVPKGEKDALLALIERSDSAGIIATSTAPSNGTSSSTPKKEMSAEQRLAAVSSMQEARVIVLEEQLRTISSLVSVNAEQLDPQEPLADLGLDSLIAIEFKNWLGRSLGADVRVHDILDADGLEPLALLVAEKSKFVPEGLPEQSNKTLLSI